MEYNESILLLQGWVLAPDTMSPPSKLLLIGCSIDGKSWEMEIPLNRQRLDVLAALGLPTDAAQCGFFFYGRLPEGRIQSLKLDSPSCNALVRSWSQSASAARSLSISRFASWRHLLRRSLYLLGSGQWKNLAERSIKHLRATLPATRRQDLAADDTPQSVDCLLIDHDLGGGANQYRNRTVVQELASGKSVLMLTFSLLGLRYVVQQFSPGNTAETVARLTWQEVLPWIDRMRPRRILYNNAVSFPDALALVEGLSAYKSERGAECHLTVAIHDYFMVCPSQHLIHADGQYCNVPTDPEICNDCLKRSQQDLVALYRHHELDFWRQAWSTFLHAADEVLIFDPSAREILNRAHRPLAPQQVILRPHTLPALDPNQWAMISKWKQGKQHNCRRIGVVGLIGSDTKGARRVHALAKAIENDRLPFEVIALGQVTPKPSGLRCFKETGPYNPQQLPQLVVDNNIDVFFFSSIGPETFSYVLHEIERFGLPVAAFNLGAQSTFINRYPFAISLNLADDARLILIKIETYFAQNPSAH